MTIPPDGVYLDTNVIMDLADVFDGWTPPSELDKTAQQKVSAAQLFFYGSLERSGWNLVISADGRAELTARGAPDWTQPIFTDIDQVPGQPPAADITARATQFEAVGARSVDARHLARADLTLWIQLFVTNDKKLRNAAARSNLRQGLHVINSIEAANRLKIEPGEAPPISPAADNPLAANTWWIPPLDERPRQGCWPVRRRG